MLQRLLGYSACCVSLLASAGFLSAQGLIVNELSNGSGGTREFVELVVLGTGASEACGPVDVRNWIIDDNNGDFSCGPCATTGIAQGHIRLSNAAVWSAVPAGAIIVIYNDSDADALMPPDDPDDTAPHDSVYIVPVSHPSVQFSTSSACGSPNIPNPSGSCPTCTGNPNYTGVCYTAGAGWTNVNMRNQGDAMQVRQPNGNYFHGFAYGTAGFNMTGGPDGLLANVAGGSNCFFFTNSGSNNYRLLSNWSSAAWSLATPGEGNTAANRAWIEVLLEDCLLPVEYALALRATPLEKGNRLDWKTAVEMNSSHFLVERAGNAAGPFEVIGEVGAAGNSDAPVGYEFLDGAPLRESYYRLNQVDLNGMQHLSDVVEVRLDAARLADVRVWPHPTQAVLNYDVWGQGLREVALLDELGRKLVAHSFGAGTVNGAGQIQMGDLAAGLYFLQVQTEKGMVREKVVHVE